MKKLLSTLIILVMLVALATSASAMGMVGGEMTELVIGENVAEIIVVYDAEWDEYYGMPANFQWVATQAGTLTIDFSDDDEYAAYANIYVMDAEGNMEMTGIYEKGGSVSTQVVEGDTVMMEVASMDMLSEEGTVYFHFTLTMGEATGPSDCTHEYTHLEPDPENEANMIEYCDECGAVLGVHAPGTEKNPILVDFLYDEVTMNLYGTVTVPAGESLWFGQYRIGGMILVVNGVEYGMLEDAGFYDPVVFKLTNDTDADVTYEIQLTWPLGSDYNPDEMPVNSSTELYLPENSYEYVYRWFATEDGELTITIEGENWMFVVNNYTTYVYGDKQWDCYGDPNTITVQVSAGDEIVLYVGTDDGNWGTPEATLTITATFTAEGGEEGPCTHENLIHVEAVVPGCYEEGNIEHWYCEDCEIVWADEALTQVTNHKSVILPATHQHIVHVEAKAPSCYEEGNVEYWYCEDCVTVWVDEAMMQISNMMSIVLPATHQHVVHVEAVAPTCTEHGNVEYWYCEDCLTVWVDEAMLQISNMKNIVDPAIGHNYVDGVCANCGENDKNVPETGDMIALACVLSAVSGMTIIALPKKKEN